MGKTYAVNTGMALVQTDCGQKSEPGRGNHGKAGWWFAAVEYEMMVAFDNRRLETGRLDLGVG